MSELRLFFLSTVLRAVYVSGTPAPSIVALTSKREMLKSFQAQAAFLEA